MAWKLNDKEGTLENFTLGSGTLYDNFHFAMTKSSEYDIIVKTRDTAGAVITGCSIYVDNVATGATDSDGYQFINKGTDSYIIKATKTGYYDTQKTIAHTDGDITNVFLDMEYKYSNLDKIIFYPDDNKYVKQYDDYTGDRVFATVNRTDLGSGTFTSSADGEVTGHSERSLFDAFLKLTSGTPETTRVVMVKDDVDDYVRFYSGTGETKTKLLRSEIASGDVPDVSPALSRKDCFDYMAEIATGTHPPDVGILTTDLLMHVDFETANVTKDGSDLVSQANDVSGSNIHLTQATSSNQPIHYPTEVNSKGAVGKKSSGVWGLVGDATSAYNGANGYTVFIVESFGSTVAPTTQYHFGNSGGQFNGISRTLDTDFRFYRMSSTNYHIKSLYGPGNETREWGRNGGGHIYKLYTGSTVIHTIVYSGLSTHWRINNCILPIDRTNGTTPHTLAAAWTEPGQLKPALGMGNYYVSSGNWSTNSRCAETVIYQNTLNNENITKVNDYLASKYGINLGTEIEDETVIWDCKYVGNGSISTNVARTEITGMTDTANNAYLRHIHGSRVIRNGVAGSFTFKVGSGTGAPVYIGLGYCEGDAYNISYNESTDVGTVTSYNYGPTNGANSNLPKVVLYNGNYEIYFMGWRLGSTSFSDGDTFTIELAADQFTRAGQFIIKQNGSAVWTSIASDFGAMPWAVTDLVPVIYGKSSSHRIYDCKITGKISDASFRTIA